MLGANPEPHLRLTTGQGPDPVGVFAMIGTVPVQRIERLLATCPVAGSPDGLRIGCLPIIRIPRQGRLLETRIRRYVSPARPDSSTRDHLGGSVGAGEEVGAVTGRSDVKSRKLGAERAKMAPPGIAAMIAMA